MENRETGYSFTTSDSTWLQNLLFKIYHFGDSIIPGKHLNGRFRLSESVVLAMPLDLIWH